MTALRSFAPFVCHEWNLADGQADCVSVIVPVYNRRHVVGETLASVLSQTHRPIELVIVDDGSSDGTVETVKQWMDELEPSPGFTVRLVLQENSGAPAARNHGIRVSHGEFLQFLDSDDLLDAGKIATQVDSLRASPSADFAYGCVYVLEDRTQMIYGHSELSASRMVLKQVSHPTFSTLAPLCRRSMIQGLGPWDEGLPLCQDWEYFSRAALLGFRGTYTPIAHGFLRLRTEGGLSWRGQPERAGSWLFGRTRHLQSMWFYASPELREDAAFRSALAWEWIQTAAQAVRLGCSVDDGARYAEAADLAGRNRVSCLAHMAGCLRKIAGARAASSSVLGASWLYYRWRALRARCKRGTARTVSLNRQEGLSQP